MNEIATLEERQRFWIAASAQGASDDPAWMAVLDQSALIDLMKKHSGHGRNNIALNDFFNTFCKRFDIECEVRHWNHTIALRSNDVKKLATVAAVPAHPPPLPALPDGESKVKPNAQIPPRLPSPSAGNGNT